MTQLGQAATSHSWQRAVRLGCSSVAPHSHVVDMASTPDRAGFVPPLSPSRVRSGARTINVIVFISGINYFYH